MLKIKEIFYSIQGETSSRGLPTVFIRTSGCPVRCSYCDTSYAFAGGEVMSFEEILQEVYKYNPTYITLTGGEPLAQPNSFKLLKILSDKGYKVSVETGGFIDISNVPNNVRTILDIKTPGSSVEQHNDLKNLTHLKNTDEIKFVICDRNDFEWSVEFVKQYNLLNQFIIWFSPSYKELKPIDLATWILESRLPIAIQTQLHKEIWGEKEGV